MPLQAYHRPESLEAALSLLDRPQTRVAVIAGGTYITPHLDRDVDEIIDLQQVGLDEVQHTETTLTLGAMVRLQTIVDDEDTPALLRETAHSAGPNTFRNQGTIGGTIVAAHPDSELLAALLVFQAQVTITSKSGERQVALSDFLADVRGALDGGLVTAVSLVKSGKTARARVARTPVDDPIVAAIARRDGEGNQYLALCGIAATPVLTDPGQLDKLTPPGDFRGSSEYRKEMAKVLTGRVLAEISD